MEPGPGHRRAGARSRSSGCRPRTRSPGRPARPRRSCSRNRARRPTGRTRASAWSPSRSIRALVTQVRVPHSRELEYWMTGLLSEDSTARTPRRRSSRRAGRPADAAAGHGRLLRRREVLPWITSVSVSATLLAAGVPVILARYSDPPGNELTKYAGAARGLLDGGLVRVGLLGGLLDVRGLRDAVDQVAEVVDVHLLGRAGVAGDHEVVRCRLDLVLVEEVVLGAL